MVIKVMLSCLEKNFLSLLRNITEQKQ